MVAVALAALFAYWRYILGILALAGVVWVVWNVTTFPFKFYDRHFGDRSRVEETMTPTTAGFDVSLVNHNRRKLLRNVKVECKTGFSQPHYDDVLPGDSWKGSLAFPVAGERGDCELQYDVVKVRTGDIVALREARAKPKPKPAAVVQVAMQTQAPIGHAPEAAVADYVGPTSTVAHGERIEPRYIRPIEVEFANNARPGVTVLGTDWDTYDHTTRVVVTMANLGQTFYGEVPVRCYLGNARGNFVVDWTAFHPGDRFGAGERATTNYDFVVEPEPFVLRGCAIRR